MMGAIIEFWNDNPRLRSRVVMTLVAGMVVLAAVQFQSVMAQVERVSQADTSDSSWPPSQLQAELFKFDLALKEFVVSGHNRSNLDARVDLLATRVQPVMQLSFAWPEGTRQEITSIRDTIDRWATQVHGLPQSPEAAREAMLRVSMEVEKVRPNLQKLTLLVHELQSLDADEKRHDLVRTFRSLAATVGILGLGALAVMIILFRRYERENTLTRRLEELNASLEVKVVERTRQIQEQKELLQRILAASPVGVAMQDLNEHHTVFINQRMKQSLGVKGANSLLALRNYLVDPAVVDRLAGALARNETIDDLEVEVRGVSGSFFGLISARRINLEGRAVVLFWLYDISARKTLENRLRSLAQQDSLTGVLNHGSFRESLNTSLQDCQANARELSLILLDIDHFKTINDRFGHAVGDQALKSLVAVLRRELSDSDLLGRLGGEEFGIVMDGVGRAEALLIAERLRQSVDSPAAAGDMPTFTVSMGVAVLEKADTAASLMLRADAALYQAKRNGRNTVEFSDRNASGDADPVSHIVDL